MEQARVALMCPSRHSQVHTGAIGSQVCINGPKCLCILSRQDEDVCICAGCPPDAADGAPFIAPPFPVFSGLPHQLQGSLMLEEAQKYHLFSVGCVGRNGEPIYANTGLIHLQVGVDRCAFVGLRGFHSTVSFQLRDTVWVYWAAVG